MATPTRPERDTVMHSWCRQTDWNAPTVVGGQGAWLHTADGRRILDMSSLAESNHLGHQHPRLVAANRDMPLAVFPADWASVGASIVMDVDRSTRVLLAERLKDRRKGPWRRLYQTLCEIVAT